MNIRRNLAMILLVAALTLVLPFTSYAVSPSDWSANAPENLVAEHLYAQSAILMDYDTGEILFSKDSRIRMYPASTTKVMTVLLGLESNIGLDTIVTVPQAAADIAKDSSLIPVNPGDKLTFRDLLYGTMIASGNDGANAIAVLVSGSVSAFVEKMNQRAAELGCEGTHFNNAHGYTDDQHYTTARDLALITREAMKWDVFRDMAAQKRYTLHVDTRGEVIVVTRVTMLDSSTQYYYPECIGIKTGFTNAAGNCYIGAAQFEDRIVISVVLKTSSTDVNQKWLDSEKLFDYAKTQYGDYGIADLYSMVAAQIGSVTVENASEEDIYGGKLTLNLAQLSNNEYSRMALKNSANDMSRVLTEFAGNVTITPIAEKVVAPITEGEIIANFTYAADGMEPITGLLVASRSVEKQPQTLKLTDILPFLDVLDIPIVRVILLIVLLLLVMLITIRIQMSRRRQHRRRRIYEQRRRQKR